MNTKISTEVARNRSVSLDAPVDEELKSSTISAAEESAEDRIQRIKDFVELTSILLGSGGYNK